jgi:hypothetical protein
MNLMKQLRYEVSRSIHTLQRRYANSADDAEKKTILRLIAAMEKKQRQLEHPTLLAAANLLADTNAKLEKAIAAVKTGPFDGYLTAMEEHLPYTLSGARTQRKSVTGSRADRCAPAQPAEDLKAAPEAGPRWRSKLRPT